MLPEDSSFALSAAAGIVCDLRREEIIVVDINTQRAKLRTALQRHYYSYGQLISACEHAENSGKRAELGRLLSRVTEEMTYVDGSNGQGGSAGAGVRSPLPKPPGGLAAGAKKSQPRTDQVEPGFLE